jgi:glycosyltransferase involved in cell wall biosynthesis
MKVLVFTSLYPNNIWPNQGVFVEERMAGLAKHDGCRIKVIAPVPFFPKLRLGWRWSFSQVTRRQMRDEIEVYHPRYPMIPKVGMAVQGLMMFLSMLPVMRRIQQDFNFDLIDAHYAYPDGFAAVLLGRYFGKPVTVTAHGSDINLFKTFPVIRKLLRFTLNRADRVIAVSQALKNSIVDLSIEGKKINVLPNGVDVHKFFRVPKEKARHQLGLPLTKKIILSVGSLIPLKGFDLLIKAIKILTEELGEQELYLVIVGGGNFRKNLESLVSSLRLDKYVRLVGVVPHDELRLWYSAADIFCLVSSREGWPCVLLESMACGTPVVATPVGGIPEVIPSERIGLLTQRDERKIAAAIRAALAMNWRPQDLIEYAGEHSWEHTAQAIRDLFETILGAKEELIRELEFRA